MEAIQVAKVLAEQSKKIGKVYAHDKFELLNIQLRTGEKVPEHNANNEVIIIVRSGEVLFNIEGKEQHLTNEDILIMKPLEKHSLVAVTDVDIIVIKV